MKPELKILEKLDYKAHLFFSYLTCIRLYPNYIFFSNKYNFGNHDVLAKSLDFIQKIALHPEANLKKDSIADYCNEININTPFPEKFETVLASSAMDACTAILETLEFTVDKSFTRIVDVSTFATDSVDMYIQERDNLDYGDPNFEKIILDDPLMKQELKIQTGIINYLSKIKDLGSQDLETLLSLQGTKGNLQLQ